MRSTPSASCGRISRGPPGEATGTTAMVQPLAARVSRSVSARDSFSRSTVAAGNNCTAAEVNTASPRSAAMSIGRRWSNTTTASSPRRNAAAPTPESNGTVIARPMLPGGSNTGAAASCIAAAALFGMAAAVAVSAFGMAGGGGEGAATGGGAVVAGSSECRSIGTRPMRAARSFATCGSVGTERGLRRLAATGSCGLGSCGLASSRSSTSRSPRRVGRMRAPSVSTSSNLSAAAVIDTTLCGGVTVAMAAGALKRTTTCAPAWAACATIPGGRSNTRRP